MAVDLLGGHLLLLFLLCLCVALAVAVFFAKTDSKGSATTGNILSHTRFPKPGLEIASGLSVTSPMQTLQLRSEGRLLAGSRANETVLRRAAKSGDAESVQQLLARGTDVNCRDWNGSTPMFWEFLMGRSVHPDGLTPLALAASFGHTAVVQLLLAVAGVDVNSPDRSGNTPLFWAAMKGHIAVVRLLLAMDGIDVNARTQLDQLEDWSALIVASMNGHTEIVRMLLAVQGIEVAATTTYGHTPLFFAAMKGHVEIARLLLAVGGIDVNVTDTPSRWTPLMVAAQYGQIQVVRLLLTVEGVDVQARDNGTLNNGGKTASMLALGEGHLEVVQLLVEVEVNSRRLEAGVVLGQQEGDATVGGEEVVDAKVGMSSIAASLDDCPPAPLTDAARPPSVPPQPVLLLKVKK